MRSLRAAFLACLAASAALGQTYQRTGACPSLGCIFPPDQASFLPGAYFDIRLEVQAPVNGSEAYANGQPDQNFTFCIQRQGESECKGAVEFFGKSAESPLENWTFSWFEDLYAKDAGMPSVVNVVSRVYRANQLFEPGQYTAYLKYYNGMETVANWVVREANTQRKAKNVILFIGDGMAVSMITAARLIGHKSINGVYQSLLQLDQMEALGHQMTHSIDSFITDSANSATALYTGHKSTVNALNVYRDSSPNAFDDPKIESWAEIFRRTYGGPVGIVSTAYIADATPAAMCAHTRDRSKYQQIVTEYLHNAEYVNSTYEWPTSCQGVDVLFGGGAEQFIAGKGSPNGINGTSFYSNWTEAGYKVVYNATELNKTSDSDKTLGIFSVSNMAKWLDRNVYTDNLVNQNNSATGDKTDALDQPGLKQMTLKAIDILHNRSKKNDSGFVMMSEAASIDKMAHVLDYDRMLGELLELDDTVRATLAHLEELGILNDTLVVVTADHGHGFDIYGGADTKYLAAQTDDRNKRKAIGIYAESGQSGYQVANGSLPTNQTIVYGDQGPNFPVQWSPRYAFAAGFGANPDHREGFAVNQTGIRIPATAASNSSDFYANPADQPSGFLVNGTLPTEEPQGVHSLTDVAVFASGPGAAAFRGVYNSIDIFYKIADALALGRTSSS